jgi:hypothetical protein
MLIPKRYTPKPKELPKQEVNVVERVAESKSDTAAIVAEIKKVLPVSKSSPKYVFSIFRDDDGLMNKVVATPVEPGTII